ncbi:MAG: ABC transporter permease [Oscillospiraceae bacterium]|jgi:putative ABC transport system permease protein|nr:ABC transporter permease [Oscillospiraceae bacterium]
MTSAELALRNVKKSIRDYTIYFLTLTFAVCVFYIFNALESQQAIMSVSKNQAPIFRELGQIMSAMSVFVSVILGFLIVYANRFLIKRRKREFGVYMTLGMDRGKISRILIMETVFVGIFSLVIGLALGAVLSQGMAVMTARLLNAPITELRFVFSPESVVKTAIYFGIMFLLILIFNTIMISRQRLITLIYASRKNEAFRAPKLHASVAMFALSVVFLGVAYALVLSGKAAAKAGGYAFQIAIPLGIAGTFLFFFSLSGFFLKLIQQSKKLYLKNLNMFILRQINSKINTAYLSMTMVCLMLFVSISALSSGMGFSSVISELMSDGAPYDASFSVYAKTTGEGETTQGSGRNPALNEYPGFNLIEAIGEQGVSLDAFAKEYTAVRYHSSGRTMSMAIAEIPVVQTIDVPIYYLKLSDYNAALALQNVAPISLDTYGYAVNFAPNDTILRNSMRLYMEEGAYSVELGGSRYQTSPTRLYRYALENSKYADYNINIIVPDEATEGLPVYRDALHIRYLNNTDAVDALCTEELSKLTFGKGIETFLTTRREVMSQSNSATTIVSYLAVYLGVIFLMSAAAMLAIGQLSETSDNMGRYALLRKLGAEDAMINNALLVQILIYFGAPMLLALVHSIAGIGVAARMVSAVDDGGIWSGALFTAAAMIVIYGGYFLATYRGSQGILNRDYAEHRKGAV